MSHPFTSQRRALFIYGGIWGLVTLVYAGLLYYLGRMSFTVIVTEAVFSAFLFSLLGLIIWYPTRYIPFKKEAAVNSIIIHSAAGVIIILIWIALSVGIPATILENNEAYQEFLSASLVWRGIIGVMLYLFMVLVYYLISYARRLSERAKSEEKLRTIVKESELNLLKSQINPHFLFNSLNSISSLIMSNPSEAQEMTIRLSEFLRYSLKHRENKFVLLEEEIIRMKDYLAIEKVRFGERLMYNLNSSKECNKLKVPTMILQPLIENAIKHGVYESIEPVRIEFDCELKDGFLILTLINDFDASQPSRKGTGMGLQNVTDRIKLVYDSKGFVRWGIDNGRFSVILYIPIN